MNHIKKESKLMEIVKKIGFKGESGNTYIFNVYPWDTKLVCSGVVYIVMRRNKFGYTIIYADCTGMFNGHILHHPLLKKFNDAGKTHIGVHIEPSMLVRYAKKKDLIENFAPVLNRFK